MNQYEVLDKLIVGRLSYTDSVSLLWVSAREVGDEADRIANATGRNDFRVIDGRLQALRKRGEIEFVKGGWRLKRRDGDGHSQ